MRWRKLAVSRAHALSVLHGKSWALRRIRPCASVGTSRSSRSSGSICKTAMTLPLRAQRSDELSTVSLCTIREQHDSRGISVHSLLLHDHRRAQRHPLVEVDDIFVGEPEAA